MQRIQIRKAVYDDWPAIAAGNSALAAETEGKRLSPQKIEPGVRAVLEDDSKGLYYVACDGSLVVGQLMYTWEWSDWRNGVIWWLQSVYVHPEYRGRGIFRTLYEHVQGLAQSDEEVVGLRLYVERENSRAQQTYRKLGMKLPGYFVMEALFDKAVGN